MKFSDIKYETRSGRRGNAHGIYIKGNNWIPKFQVIKMWEQAQKKLSLLDWSYSKTTKSFFDSAAWKEMSRGHHIALGRCMRYFAEHQMLPLRCINQHKKGTKRYVLINDAASLPQGSPK
jgi:hypothetical protein